MRSYFVPTPFARADDGYWNRMSRSARIVEPGVIEVRSYFDRRLRFIALLLAVATIVLTGFFEPFRDASRAPQAYPFEAVVRDYKYVFQFDDYIQWSFETRNTFDEPFDEYKASLEKARSMHLPRARNSLIFYFVFYTGFIWLALLWPRLSPLRIDRNRGVAYTWRMGKLLVIPLSQSPKFNEAATPGLVGSKHFLPNTGWGPVVLPMHSDGGKAAKPIFGAYPPTGMDMNTELSEMLEAFANPNREPADIEAALHRRSFLPGDILRALATLSLIPGQRLGAAKVQSGLPKAGPS